MHTTMTFEEALKMLKEGNAVSQLDWNWLSKQSMCIKTQFPDENSKMTEPYLYMEIIPFDNIIKRVPRMPSRLDMFSDQRIVA
jgi:hypothetical protein